MERFDELLIPQERSTSTAKTPRVFTEQEVLTFAKRASTEGRATFEVIASRGALLVIDMQDEFLKPGWTPFWVPEAPDKCPASIASSSSVARSASR